MSLRVAVDSGVTEVVGTLLAASPEMLSVRRRDGSVIDVTVDSVQAQRVVPPGPARRIPVADLQRIADRGWRAAETEPLGEWLLRAAGGFTSRANSALVAGDPGVPLGTALDAVETWYQARGLRPYVQLAGDATPPGLTDLLDDRGWTTSPAVHVMTAELGPVLRAATRSPDVPATVEPAPDEAWLASYRQDFPGRNGGALPAAALAVLTNHDRVGFVSIRDGEHCVAVARAAVDGRWVGLFGVEVDPAHRRRGLGRAVSRAALRWAVANGGRWGYLQASTDDAAAVSLYDAMGFAVHHDYVYRISPAEPSVASTGG